MRVIHFSRIDLMPTEQDIYNADAELETQVLYGPYQDFNGTSFPRPSISSARWTNTAFGLRWKILRSINRYPTTSLSESPQGVQVQRLE